MRHVRDLRADRTKAEGLLWSRLRGQQLGVKFRRQHPVTPYVADFACMSAKLIVEIDGRSHDEREKEDVVRTAYLARLGWRVVRYHNLDVLDKIDAVVADIHKQVSGQRDS